MDMMAAVSNSKNVHDGSSMLGGFACRDDVLAGRKRTVKQILVVLERHFPRSIASQLEDT